MDSWKINGGQYDSKQWRKDDKFDHSKEGICKMNWAYKEHEVKWLLKWF